MNLLLTFLRLAIFGITIQHFSIMFGSSKDMKNSENSFGNPIFPDITGNKDVCNKISVLNLESH